MHAPRNAIYNQNLSKDETFKGKSFWVARFEVDETGKSLKLYNEGTESMIFEDEEPGFFVEYAPNKMFMSG